MDFSVFTISKILTVLLHFEELSELPEVAQNDGQINIYISPYSMPIEIFLISSIFGHALLDACAI